MSKSRRFPKFCAVGLSGVLVNEGILWALTEFAGLFYLISSAVAVEASIITNFILNELWTFSDLSDKNHLKRLPKFNLVSLAGLAINMAVLFALTASGMHYLLSNLFGIGAAVLWNYFINLRWTWRPAFPDPDKSGRAKRVEITTSSVIKEPFVSLVIPTYNEANNIEHLVESVFSNAPQKAKLELIIVDDSSPDGTGNIAEGLSKKYPGLRVVHRQGKLGLSTAVLKGFSLASGNILGVMDADFSHPPEKIPRLVESVIDGYDIAIGSRYSPGGGIEDWPFSRKIISRGATLMAKPITPVKDPMSGFFFLRKPVVETARLNPKGFKILLEILANGNYKSVKEMPYVFTDRAGGKSKLGKMEFLNYFAHCLKLYLQKMKK